MKIKSALLILSILFFSKFSFCQWWIPTERFGDGQYWEYDAKNFQDYPYTCFKRNLNIPISQQIENIRNLIRKKNNEIYDFYTSIYKFSIETQPPTNNTNDKGNWTNNKFCKKVNQNPAWAKALAFINLIGIDTAGNELTQAQKINLKWCAEKALKDMDTDVEWWAYEKLFCRSRELIQMVQAYDLLKADGYLKNDRNADDLSARDNIRKFARDIYNEANDVFGVLLNPWGWKKNHGISTAAALGIAAIVLNECDAGYFYDGWKANNWARLAHWGIYECLFDAESHSTSQRGGLYSYSEGPGYFNYGIVNTALPFFIAFDNFVSPVHDSWKYPYGKWNWDANHIKNYMHDPDIQNLFEWMFNIQQPNGAPPNYDNSNLFNPVLIGLYDNKYNRGDQIDVKNLAGDFDLRVDYIAAIGGQGESALLKKSTEFDLPNVVNMPNAGNLVLRMNQDISENRQYFMFLDENGIADDQGDGGGTHEDDDKGSFILTVDDDILAIDPGYLGFEKCKFTNKAVHHNTIMFDNEGIKNSFRDDFDFFNWDNFSKNFSSTFDYTTDFYKNTAKIDLKGWENNWWFYDGNEIKYSRQVQQIRLNSGTIFYLLTDNVKGKNSNNKIRFQLNGNGNLIDEYPNTNLKTFQYDTSGTNRKFYWKHPCGGYKNNGKWNLFAHVAALNAVNNTPVTSFVTSDNEYGTVNSNNDYNEITINKNASTVHTRLEIYQNTNKTIFQTVLLPYRCNNESNLPEIFKIEKENYVSTIVKFKELIDTFSTALFKTKNTNLVTDTVAYLFYTSNGSGNNDTIINPFKLASLDSSKIIFNGNSASVEYHSIPKMSYGFHYCPATYSHIQSSTLENGDKLLFNDSVIFKSNVKCNYSSSIIGRHVYKVHCEAVEQVNSNKTFELLLTDLDTNLQMVALQVGSKDTLNSEFDSISKRMKVFTSETGIDFTIEEKNKCADCYFPPANINIDTVFDADDGLKHILGHKLQVKLNKGTLNVLNGTKISMCEGVYLHNKQNISLESRCQWADTTYTICKGIDSILNGNKNSAIIISPHSALVLESGSHTWLKKGSAIYVKNQGSLIVKNGAYLQIGDSGTCGWAEIIAEQGAYVYVEPGAHIAYTPVRGDTSDHNRFILRLQGGSASAGIAAGMDSILIHDTIMANANGAIALCDIDSICPIQNKNWGYTNFAKPLATFQCRKDTLCPNEPVYIYLNKILNDANARITVCRMDSVLRYNHAWYYADTCINDTIVLDSIPPDPVCRNPHAAPDHWVFHFKANTLHRIHIEVLNECGKFHDTLAYIFIADTPQFSISVPPSACEGSGQVWAQVQKLKPLFGNYAWEITELADTNNLALRMANPSAVYTQSFSGNPADSFNFPGYYFKGGRKYLVSLTILNNCGGTTRYDTLSIPSGAAISLKQPKAYGNPMNGIRSVQLHALCTSSDSVRWQPSIYLNRNDTTDVISTPEDSVSYILSSYKNTCVSYDTTHIVYNRMAYSNPSDTICFTASNGILLGNSYHEALFIGWLSYYNLEAFKIALKDRNIDPDYFQNFSRFLLSNHIRSILNENNLYHTFAYQLCREDIIKQTWYKNYYTNFIHHNYDEQNILDTFYNYVNNNATIKSNLDSISSWSQVNEALSNILDEYEGVKNDLASTISIAWSKIVKRDTLAVANWRDYYVIIDTPKVNSTYILRVIEPESAEIDEITAFVDTILVPDFMPVLEIDSMVYFNNFTEPQSTITQYTWDFGDGTANVHTLHALHTFAANNQKYNVCLSATNLCGTWMKCDTIWVDSNHQMNRMNYARKLISDNPSYQNENNNLSQKTHSKLTQNTIESLAQMIWNIYPNPFTQAIQLDYLFENTPEKSEFILYNLLGEKIQTQRISNAFGTLSFNTEYLSKGIYFITLHENGKIKETRKVVKVE